MRIAICDDEKSQLNYLDACVRRFSEIHGLSLHISLFDSAEKFWFSWEKDNFSLILLDIQMQGQNGMDLARELRQRGDNSAIIFITGLSEYIGCGYDVSAVHYLMKPIDENKLFAAMEKAISAVKKQPKKLIFSVGGENIVLPAQEIEYAEAFSHTTVLSLGERHVEVSQSFGSVLSTLQNEGFVRCHRSYAVHILHIHSIKKYEITLDSGKTVPVSRRLYDAVKSTCFDAQVGTNISDKYRYVVRACASGKKGEFSEAVKAQKAESCNILPPEKPILQAVAREKQRIDLFWTPVKANALLSHYEIYRNGEKIAATTDAYVCTYRDRTVSFGKTYTYSVAAVNKFGNKSVSDAVVLPHTSDMFARTDSKTAKKRHKSLYSLLMLKK